MVKVPVTVAGEVGITVNWMAPVGSASPQHATLSMTSLATVKEACAKALTDRAKNSTAANRIVFFRYNCSFAKRGGATRPTGFLLH
jgi:hypothetical protein